jgi:hypothetical protein
MNLERQIKDVAGRIRLFRNINHTVELLGLMALPGALIFAAAYYAPRSAEALFLLLIAAAIVLWLRRPGLERSDTIEAAIRLDEKLNTKERIVSLLELSAPEEPAAHGSDTAPVSRPS